MPNGTQNQTLRFDGTNWVGSSLIENNGIDVGINLPSAFCMVVLKSTSPLAETVN